MLHLIYNILIKKYINRMKNPGPENPDQRPRLFANPFVSSLKSELLTETLIFDSTGPRHASRILV